MRHLMSPLDFSVEELDKLLNLADDIGKNPKKYAHTCDDKRLATLFYEPSTRTRLSFEAAILEERFSVFLLLIPAPHPKAKALPILFALFPVMQISVLCVIRKRVLRL